MFIVCKRMILTLLLMAVLMVVHIEGGKVSADECCSATSNSGDCYQSFNGMSGPTSASCSTALNCAGLSCALETASVFVSGHTECTYGFGYVNTYAAGTKVYGTGAAYGNYGQQVCTVDINEDCVTGQDTGTDSCYGSCG